MRATRQLGLPPGYVGLESSYARNIRDVTAEPTTNVAADHSNVPQAATGATERPLLQLRKSRIPFHQAFETVPCQIKLAEAINGTN